MDLDLYRRLDRAGDLDLDSERRQGEPCMSCEFPSTEYRRCRRLPRSVSFGGGERSRLDLVSDRCLGGDRSLKDPLLGLI